MLFGLSRRTNLRAPHAVAAGRLGGADFRRRIAGIVNRHGWHLDIGQFTLHGVTPEKLRMGLVLAIFSSVGFESATSLGSEARNPLTAIPRAVKWSAILAGMFFFLCAYAEVLGFHGEAQSLDQSPAPLHVLAQKVGLPPLVGTLTDVGAVLSFLLVLSGVHHRRRPLALSHGAEWRAALGVGRSA